jgi:hypothetical protein
VHRARLGAGKPAIGWEDPQARDALVPALVNDANVVVAAFADAELDESAASALALLALSPGRTSSPPRAATAPAGGGGSPGGSPKIG